MTLPQLSAYNEDDRQYVIDDATGISWSSHYGYEGSGFGYLKFTLQRPIGVDYKDIGYGYRVTLRKYLNTILFDGQIRQIEESSSANDDKINITCLGYATVAEDDEVTKAYCDTRLGEWIMESETPSGGFRPDLFNVASSDVGLTIKATSGQNFAIDDYTVVKYNFADDEIAKQLRCDVTTGIGIGTAPGNGTSPRWTAEISAISGAVVTYTNVVGEGNVVVGNYVVNATKLGSFVSTAVDTGANTITCGDASYLTGWGVGDTIYAPYVLFVGTISSVASDVITFTPSYGEDICGEAVGWALYNATDDEWATVQAWDLVNNTVTVTASGDISTWGASDLIAISSPFRTYIKDSEGTLLWPTDWREGTWWRSHEELDLETTGSPTGFKVQLQCYVAGYTTTDQYFVTLHNLKVFSSESESTATVLAQDAVAALSATGHGLSSDTDNIESVGKQLEPMVFEFSTWKEALSWACSYGDGNGNLLAWGVRLDDNKKLFLETQDRTTIDYVVRRDAPVSASAGGDLQNAYQKVRGIYDGINGEQRLTAWQLDSDSYFSGYYRATSVKLDGVTDEDEADSLVELFLDENKSPKTRASYSVSDGSTFTEAGLPIPFDEIKATGKIVMIEDWRAVETGTSTTDLRDSWTKENIVAVEINYDSGSVNLTPASARSTFQEYMAELSRVRGG